MYFPVSIGKPASYLCPFRKTSDMRPLLLALVAVVITVSSGCKDDDHLDPALYGKWQVTKVQGRYYYSNIPSPLVTDNSPQGTIEFKSDGTGYQNYSFQFGGNTQQHIGAFVWEADDEQIRIDRVDEPDMVWTRITKLTNRQEATYTHIVDENQKWDFTLTLEK